MTSTDVRSDAGGALDRRLLYRLLIAVPGLAGAALIVQQAAHELSRARLIRESPEAEHEFGRAAEMLTSLGVSRLVLGLLVGVAVLAVVLPRRLPLWLGLMVAVPGFALLAVGAYSGQPWWPGVVFPPVVAAVRLMWQASRREQHA